MQTYTQTCIPVKNWLMGVFGQFAEFLPPFW